MAIPSPTGDFVTLLNAKIWWKQSSNEIHLTINDDDLNHPNTDPGMRVVFSVNPKSANYHPANFNRCADVLRHHGKAAPAENVPEGNRRLDKRGE
jgi:hypothetical protein